MLASLTLFSVPATYPEAFGRYLIEAMASGVPVVLVPPGDPIALAMVWNDLLKRPEALQTFREKGRHAAVQFYSVEAMRDRFLSLAQPLVP